MILLLLFAFLAGVATVLSPCVLPVIPAIFSSGLSGGKYRPLGVIIGLVVSFFFFTLALTSLVQLIGLSANFLRYTAILLIGFFGLIMILPYLEERFTVLTASIANLGNKLQSQSATKRPGLVGGLILGSALGLVWTPCAGPILAAITTLVATRNLSFEAVAITLSYSIGMGIPLFLMAYGGQRVLQGFPQLARYSERIRQGFGVLMLLTALALAFNWDSILQQWTLDYFPNIQIENNQRVQQELNRLRPSPVGFPNVEFSPYLGDGSSTEGQELPKIALAPELVGITQWINSEPLNLKELKGRVVLIDFWTYSCINCIRTFPYLKEWYQKYKDKGFLIIGVHTPEFEFEKKSSNVKKAAQRFDLTYPIAMDNHYATWLAYHNAYWPAHYLIDQEGILREIHYGEGDYLKTENAIRSLLNEVPLNPTMEDQEEANKKVLVSFAMTPETYLGYKRAMSYSSELHLVRDQAASYTYSQSLKENQVGLKGDWKLESEDILSESDDSSIHLNFVADQVYLVLGGESSFPIRVELDGRPLPKKYYTEEMTDRGEIFVKESRKYDIVNLKGNNGRHVLSLYVPKGIKAYAFTFGN